MNKPIYLSGVIRPELLSLHRHGAFLARKIGFLLTPKCGNRPDFSSSANLSFAKWGADNGCFTHPEEFDLDKYLAWLATRPRRNCLFVNAPDVVGNARATLKRSMPVLPLIRAAGFKAALVAQDGMERLTVPWRAFDCLFIGGSTEWKLSEHAIRLCHEARARGKWVHVGRVNSKKRLDYCGQHHNAHSTDGTFLAFAPTRNFPRMLSWYQEAA